MFKTKAEKKAFRAGRASGYRAKSSSKSRKSGFSAAEVKAYGDMKVADYVGPDYFGGDQKAYMDNFHKMEALEAKMKGGYR